jgi:hypothetical protein
VGAGKAHRNLVAVRVGRIRVVTVRADRNLAEDKVARTLIAVAKEVRVGKTPIAAARAVKSPVGAKAGRAGNARLGTSTLRNPLRRVSLCAAH